MIKLQRTKGGLKNCFVSFWFCQNTERRLFLFLWWKPKSRNEMDLYPTLEDFIKPWVTPRGAWVGSSGQIHQSALTGSTPVDQEQTFALNWVSNDLLIFLFFVYFPSLIIFHLPPNNPSSPYSPLINNRQGATKKGYKSHIQSVADV